MTDTTTNLKSAFAGESQAYQKYLAFADAAKRAGFVNIARLFRTTAEAERIHAAGHLKALESVGTVVENLKAAIAGETYETDEMYPPMYEQAVQDDHKAKRMFGYALKAEAVHARLYQLALEAAERGEDLSVTKFYLCPVCGYIEFGEAPDECPVCGAKKKAFLEVAA